MSYSETSATALCGTTGNHPKTGNPYEPARISWNDGALSLSNFIAISRRPRPVGEPTPSDKKKSADRQIFSNTSTLKLQERHSKKKQQQQQQQQQQVFDFNPPSLITKKQYL